MARMVPGAGEGARSGSPIYLLSVIGAMTIWSTSFTVTKIALRGFPPLTIGALRFSLAAMLLACFLRVPGAIARPSRAGAGWLILGGLLGITAYFSLENVGVMWATAADASLLVAAYPAITMLLEAALFRARVPWGRYAAAGVALAGVYLIVRGIPGGSSPHRLAGDFLLIVTGVVWTFYSFVTRRAQRMYSTLTVTFYQTNAGAIAFLPLAAAEHGSWHAPSLASTAAVIYLGVFCSVAAFFLYAYGLKELDAGTAITLINLVPVVGLIISVAVLKEHETVVQLAGGMVVIVGIVISTRLALHPRVSERAHSVQRPPKDVVVSAGEA
jgi:drug/metabolite transporter (DMT)-like permease